jgi:hypothetical protein
MLFWRVHFTNTLLGIYDNLSFNQVINFVRRIFQLASNAGVVPALPDLRFHENLCLSVVQYFLHKRESRRTALFGCASPYLYICMKCVSVDNLVAAFLPC